MKTKQYQVGWWLIFLSLAVITGFSVVMPFLFPHDNQGYLSMFLGELLIAIPCIVGCVVLKRTSNGTPLMQTLRLQKFPLILLPFLILLPTFGQYFFSLLSTPVTGILQLLFGIPDQIDLMPDFSSKMDYIWAFGSLCVLAPVLEELLCRGIFMRLLQPYGVAVSLVTSAVAFAMLHMNAQGFVVFFFLGLLLGLCVYATGSLFASMIMHCANNALAFTLMLVYKNGDLSIISVLVVFIAAALFPFLLWKFVHITKRQNSWTNHLPQKQARHSFSVAMILCIIIFVGFHAVLFASRLLSGDLLSQLFDFANTYQNGF